MALAEAGFNVSVPKDSAKTFQFISKVFDIKFTVGPSEIDIPDIEFDHKAPSLKIGKVEKSLLFPKSMINLCKNFWDKDKSGISFQGLMTKKRQKSLNNWLLDKYNIELCSWRVALKRYISRRLHKNNQISFIEGDIKIIESTRGREFPIKAWDREYYDQMLRSKFVLCPDGDFIWTYRFFEAIMCGAIPIIDNECKLYDDFTYFSMSDNIEALQYNKQTVLDNLKKLEERFTLTEKDIREIKKTLLIDNF